MYAIWLGCFSNHTASIAQSAMLAAKNLGFACRYSIFLTISRFSRNVPLHGGKNLRVLSPDYRDGRLLHLPEGKTHQTLLPLRNIFGEKTCRRIFSDVLEDGKHLRGILNHIWDLIRRTKQSLEIFGLAVAVKQHNERRVPHLG